MSNGSDPDLGPICLQKLSAELTIGSLKLKLLEISNKETIVTRNKVLI